MDYAIRNYARLQKGELRKTVGKKFAEIIEQNFETLKDLAYEYQNKTLRIKFDDDHTYVIHVYYLLEVFRYISLSPAVLDFLHSKKVKGENDDIKEMILTLLMLSNPLYSLLYIMSENQKGKERRKMTR
ncbi:hypothetical protein [Saccharolobus islandicus]|nr:hypothetical protein [Sulfolobus islandicus]